MKADDGSIPPRERIMRAAKKEFSEQGYNGARTSGIARRASVNKALIHYYYRGKENLYIEVLKSIFSGMGDPSYIPDYLGKWDLTLPQKLYVCIYFMVNIFLKATDPEAMRIMFWEIAEGRKFLDSVMMEYTVPRHKLLTDIVKEGVEKGEFESKYPLLSVMGVISFISLYAVNKEIYEGKSVFLELYGRVDEKDVIDFVLGHVFKSLKPKNRKLDIPDIPEDLRLLLEELLRILVEKKDEWANEEVFRRVEGILHH